MLFNNAGIGQAYVNVEEFTMDDFDTLFRVNLASCYLGIKYAAPIMKQQGRGSIINNGSTAGLPPMAPVRFLRNQSRGDPNHQSLGCRACRARNSC